MSFEMKTILLVVCALAAATTAQDCDALNKDCHLKGKDDHTMCKYTGVNPKVVDRGVSPEDIKVILKTFNDARSKIALGEETRGKGGNGQPPAALMYELEYDEDLAKVAQRWVDQAKPWHDSCHEDPRWEGTGQNYGGEFNDYDNGQDTSRNWEFRINKWFDEVENFNSEDVKHYNGETAEIIGHYTQGAWGDTKLVGCGFAMYPKEGTRWYMKFYVCNFGPSGNWYGLPVYQVGEPCSKCDGECEPDVGLCEA